MNFAKAFRDMINNSYVFWQIGSGFIVIALILISLTVYGSSFSQNKLLFYSLAIISFVIGIIFIIITLKKSAKENI